VARCRSSATAIYGWAERSPVAAPFVADPAQRSTVVATIDLDPAVSADTVCAVLRRHGIVDIEGYRKLGRNQLRVALFPAIDPADVERLTVAIDHVVERLA
jgi:phosphoserine aminotransferase